MTAPAPHPLPQRPRAPRIAVLSGYMTYYEPHMPPGFREERTAWGHEIAAILSSEGETRFFGLMTDEETGRRVGAELAEWGPDAIVLAPAMPGPPAFTWAALADLPRVPVVMWSAAHLDTLPPGYGSVDHLAASGGVGIAMIGNILARNGRRPAVVAGRWYEAGAQEEARAAVRRATVAGRLARARIGVLGAPLEGYSNVTIDAGLLRDALGAELVEIGLPEWEDAFAGAGREDIARIAEALVSRYAVTEPKGEDFLGSCRLASALETIADRHTLDCGTFNSHLDFGHRNARIGLVGGLGTSWMTSRGVPFSDTGDTITPIAMALGRMLAGNAVYTELNTIDYEADAILCSNTGEADFAAAIPEGVWIFPASDHTGKDQRGSIVDAELREGPATILGFTPHAGAARGIRLIAFPGTAAGRPELALRVPHTLFRPAGGSAAKGFSRWIEAGATHHAALCIGGDLSEDVAAVGRALGIEVEVVE